ncbi:MAG: hypothetical protein GYA58_14570 [Anaerolineaceae bacterium]|nr:hypothetical protein [Anaerolineaceae bacterium]
MKRKQLIVPLFVVLTFGISLEIFSLTVHEKMPAAQFSVSFSSTPTPYLIPQRTYAQTSTLQKILQQVFAPRNSRDSYAELLATSHKELTSEHFELYVQENYLPVDAATWMVDAEQVYAEDSSRINSALTGKVILLFSPVKTEKCAARGTTYHENLPLILIYADRDTSQKQIMATLAHELGHVLIAQKYPELSSVALNEGMATWVAKDYWQSWKNESLDDAVRRFLREGSYLPLVQNLEMEKAYAQSEDCIQNRDILLTEFASFTDYLIRTYGMDKLAVLFDIPQPEFVNNSRVVDPPDFYGVYGLQLNQLENAWLVELSAQ